jgi:hypothetical protein
VVKACEISGFKLETVLGWIDHDEQIRLDIGNARAFAPAVAASFDPEKPVARDPKTGADRWRRMHDDAEKFGGGMFGHLLAVDARVSARPGNPPMSPFFRHAFQEFYAGNYQEFCMVGARGAGKSTNQIKVATNELMFRERRIPPMDPAWIWPFMSHNMAESAKRFQPFKDTLLAVGVPDEELVTTYREDGRSKIKFCDAKGQRVEVNIFPNTKEACIGGNLAGATHDEELHWQTSSKDGTSRAEDVLEFQAGAFRADLTRVHIRISALSGMDGPMLEAIQAGTTDLRCVPTLGAFLGQALDGFAQVVEYMLAHGMFDGARRVQSWMSRLKSTDPWIPAWVGNPTHNPVDGFRLLWKNLPSWRDRVGVWLRENGSCTDPLAPESGDYFVPRPTPDNPTPTSLVDRAVHTVRVVSTGFDGRFAGIDTGATRNPSGLAIVERVIHETKTNGACVRRYQFRPHRFEQWVPRSGVPLDLRNVVIPAMARLILEARCVPAWWADGWSGDAVKLVGMEHGIHTIFVSTSTATRDIYEPVYVALSEDPCPIVMCGCDGIELAVAQLKQVRRGNDGTAIVPHDGTIHGEHGQTFLRALIHAGLGQTPPDDSRGWRSFGSDRRDSDSR